MYSSSQHRWHSKSVPQLGTTWSASFSAPSSSTSNRSYKIIWCPFWESLTDNKLMFYMNLDHKEYQFMIISKCIVIGCFMRSGLNYLFVSSTILGYVLISLFLDIHSQVYLSLTSLGTSQGWLVRDFYYAWLLIVLYHLAWVAPITY